ncbi:tRNA preQ1(34) S-adenosylmethionine ribosyltransferase-isomerase QueA [Lutispora thermophila]|uniref:S-adenosylmethionine:tRNA ribosyltransferase-isomerase n=1 Tax=Lutispora thermophila DSM 19022 TaxID=1122184 RepID=A0A1M6HPU7_9FIRM|nr:tRNA preQ1(34) S-adenosylmethionine ribosyltransferase-isomerase QueA [Lutispora thermophila]SHJ24164.1 S-adenosylmethionine--tRNA ribosyltransferase-isomerase [Lutispora thermophila DSM 19022]
MNTSDFYYKLPEELIAQEPIYPRDMSRLMILNKESGCIEHKIFKDIINYLNPGDCLVLNDTRVIPARLFGSKEGTQSTIEILLLTRKSKDTWEVMVRPGKKAKLGAKIIFGDGQLVAEIIEISDGGNRIIKFSYDGIFETILENLGHMPLPPYIKKELEDKERYQTVYSKHEGSAAAPTAGLHFTDTLLQDIENKGIKLAYITLHVGLGTFRPVKVKNIEEHKMHSEYYDINQESADKINSSRKEGKRIICVGTTSTRTLESVADENGMVSAKKGWTDIFIYPGYKFKCTDGLITNFHLPESTLLMLVSALAGKENILRAYEEAIKNKYRFFSFGDAMLII